MAKTKITGTKIDIASAFGTTKAFTAVSNASAAVFTFESGHGLIVGDFFEVLTCTWGLLENRVFRVSVLSTNDVTAERCDTNNTTRYPVGTIAGTAREITDWTRIDNRSRNFSGGGGEPNTADVSDLDDIDDKEILTTRSVRTRSLPGYFDVTKSWAAVVTAASDNATPVPGREIYPNGTRMVYSAYWSFNDVPNPEDFTLRDRIDQRFAGKPTVYPT